MIRNLLVSIFVLVSLTVQAQTTRPGWSKVVRIQSGVSQKGWARRDSIQYPQTASGISSWTALVNSGNLTISLTDPDTGPSGTSVRYSLTNGLLIVEAAGDITQLKFERVDGTAMTGNNPDGVPLQSGIFYGYGANSSPPFDKQWKAAFSPSVSGKGIKLTFKQTSGSTFAYSLIAPVNGIAVSVPLFGKVYGTSTTTPPSSTTTTPPSSTTTAPASVTALSFQIVSYDCNSGQLQIKFVSPNTTGSIAYSIPGLGSGSTSSGNVLSASLPSDRRGNTPSSETEYVVNASQTGQTSISSKFKTSCSLGPTVVTTPPSTTTTTSTVAYNRVLIPGNSITNYGGHRGLDASSPDKDYFHLLQSKLKAANPSVEVRDLSDGGMGMVETQGPIWEQKYWQMDSYFYGLFDNAAAWKPDLIIMRLAENISDLTHDLATWYKALIDKLKAQNPSATVVLTTSAWNQTDVTNIIKAVGAERNYPVADLTNIPGQFSGQASHPNDAAMAEIANRIWDAIPKSTTTVTTTPPTSVTYVPDDFDYLPYTTYVAPSDSLVTFETPNIKAVVSLRSRFGDAQTGVRLGGNIYKLYNKAEPGFSLNHYSHYSLTRNGEGAYDSEIAADQVRVGTGYGVGNCIYMNPVPNAVFSQTGYGNAPANIIGLGRNPNPGDDHSNTSLVLAYGRRSDGSGYYTKTLPVLYNAYGAYAYGTIYEDWTDFSGKLITRHSKITTNYTKPVGSSDGYGIAAFLRSDSQEMPCDYGNGSIDASGSNKNRVSMYMGNSPCTGGGLTTINVNDKKLDNGTPIYTSMRASTHNVTEPWIMYHGGGDRKGKGLIVTDSKVKIANFGSGESKPDNISPNTNTTYISEQPNVIFDNKGTVYYVYREFVGTVDEIRQEACKYQFASSPNYRFNKADRQKWSYSTYGDAPVVNAPKEKRTSDGGADSIQVNGFWRLHFGRSPYSNLVSPGVAWKAGDNQKLYIRMAYWGQNSSWGFTWKQNGQLDNRNPQDAEERTLYWKGQTPNSQSLNFSVTGDGVVRTYTIDLSNRADWADIINEVRFNPHASGVTSGTEHANIYWISSNPNGPN